MLSFFFLTDLRERSTRVRVNLPESWTQDPFYDRLVLRYHDIEVAKGKLREAVSMGGEPGYKFLLDEGYSVTRIQIHGDVVFEVSQE